MAPPTVCRILQFMLFSCLLEAGASAGSEAIPGCQDKCGNLSIPYPFGTTPECYLNKAFLITCNKSASPPQPLLGRGNLVVTNITLEGQVEIKQYIAADCYNASAQRVSHNTPKLWASMFTISNDRNKFTAVGCDTYATVKGVRGDGNNEYFTGCMSYCTERDPNGFNNSCSGIGCCQIPIPSGLKNITVSVSSYNNHTHVWDFNPCSYAFVADETKFTFNNKSFDELKNIESLPMVLDWAIGNETCKVAEHKPDYACKRNTICLDPANRSGYICKCKDGYYGNPYHPNGCQDINECKNSSLHNCISESNCLNTPGNYTCSCLKGFHGDGRKDGTRCTRNELNVIKISIAFSLCVLVVIVGSSWLFFINKKRKLLNMKNKFFRQNGGLLLQQELHERNASTETVKIFTAEELNTATKNYDESHIVGRGGFGTVYKGTLKKGTEVAIKKSRVVDQSQIKQFINEVIILSQINHRNVVKLLGCCLETEVPLLVYEFVSNGTLSDHIHCEDRESSISWVIRLRIATESAQVLSYLHSAASTPIIHRDVKPANILLDDNYTAKVSDFGASRLVPMDQTQLSTMVQGTLGYLDPEYLCTTQLTEKSDVYSFGVVLVELLTGKTAHSFAGPEEERNLVSHFDKSLRNDRLFEILDEKVAKERAAEQIQEVAKLAKRCLSIKGVERPSMKEVAQELEDLRKLTCQHPWAEVAVSMEETQFLLGQTFSVSTYVSN
ncbi:wall-associated kinase 2 [Hibiscus trionum]|uniref:Wall-associated kinase 2 n=1 Tax=Hibiscus trionum TaxID=183268 RepID=A0A9W7HK73_HIBTR|nr:wall-associated kinase 2 [Hibiscus trionum]